MAISFSGGSATIGTTEWSLPANSAGPTAQTATECLQVLIDFSAVANGDSFLLQVYEKVNAGTQRVVFQAWITFAQSQPHYPLPALFLGEGWDVTIKKLTGTDRAISWSLRSVQ